MPDAWEAWEAWEAWPGPPIPKVDASATVELGGSMAKPGAIPPSWETRFWNASEDESGDTDLASAAEVAKIAAIIVASVGMAVFFMTKV